MANGLPFSLLLVDNDEDERIFMEDAFLRLGYDQEVKKFKDSSDLFAYLDRIDDSFLPALFVFDNKLAECKMPSIIHRLHGTTRYQNILIVVYSATLLPKEQKRLLSLGVSACFEKGDTLEETLRLAKRLRDIATNNGTIDRINDGDAATTGS